jgi:hypothetical protein
MRLANAQEFGTPNPEAAWMSPFRRRNLEFRVAAQGAPRGPRAEPPIARAGIRARRLGFLWAQASRPLAVERPTHAAAVSRWR